MPNRIVCGEALWKSDKLAKVEPEWVRPEVANLIPLALANGSFECDPRKIWSEVYAFNRPSITVEKVVEILDSLEVAKILFRWTDDAGKVFGYWVGIEKSGRLPAPSLQAKGHYAKGPEVPRERLAIFLGTRQKNDDDSATSTHSLDEVETESRPRLDDVKVGLGLGLGLGVGKGKGKEAVRPENRPEPPLAFRGNHLAVSEKQDGLLKEGFPWVDRPAEYRRADSWLFSNPEKRPKKNLARFLHNWFSRVPAPSSKQGRYKEDANGKFDGLSL